MLWLLQEQLWIWLSRLIFIFFRKIYIFCKNAIIYKIHLLRLHSLLVNDSHMELLQIPKTQNQQNRTSHEQMKMSNEFDELTWTTLKMFRVRLIRIVSETQISVFWALGFIFVLIDPTESSARNHFLGFLAARVAHSFFYLCQIPQPTRGLAFFAGVGIVGSMAVQIIQKAL